MCFSVDIDSEDRELLEDTGLDPSVVTSDLNEPLPRGGTHE